MTFACLHSDGNVPETIDLFDLLNISQRDSEIIGAASLINLHGMLSKPFAFLVDNDVSIFRTLLGDFVGIAIFLIA